MREFVEVEGVKYINADEIAQNLSADNFSLLSIKAGKVVLRKIKEFANKRLNFVVETTLSGRIWKRFILAFKKINHNITIFFIYLDTPEEAVKRVAVRINKDIMYLQRIFIEDISGVLEISG